MGAVLVVAFAMLAVADWRVIWSGHAIHRPITKTLATVALVTIATFFGDMEAGARAALIVAVILCLAGDVFLLSASDTRFLAGLGAFAAGHVAYAVTALLVGVSWPRLAFAVPFLAIVLVFHALAGILPGARRRGGTVITIAVAIYSAIISAMVVTATGTNSAVAAAGAVLFATSDSIIGYHRFVRPVRRADVAIMVTYHVGQVLLILGLIEAG